MILLKNDNCFAYYIYNSYLDDLFNTTELNDCDLLSINSLSNYEFYYNMKLLKINFFHIVQQ